MKRLILPLLSIVLLVLVVPLISTAQSASISVTNKSSATLNVQDNETLKACEVCVDRLAAAEKVQKITEDRLADKDQIISLYVKQDQVKDKYIALVESANKNRTGVNVIDDQRVSACTAQLAKAEARIHSLENPGLLKRIFNTDTILAGAAGAGIGYAAGRNSSGNPVFTIR